MLTTLASLAVAAAPPPYTPPVISSPRRRYRAITRFNLCARVRVRVDVYVYIRSALACECVCIRVSVCVRVCVCIYVYALRACVCVYITPHCILRLPSVRSTTLHPFLDHPSDGPRSLPARPYRYCSLTPPSSSPRFSPPRLDARCPSEYCTAPSGRRVQRP